MPDSNGAKKTQEVTPAPNSKGQGGETATDLDEFKSLDGKEVTIDFGGEKITYKLIADWTQFVSQVDLDEGGRTLETATDGLKKNTIKGIIGTMSLIMALGHTSTKITSMVRKEDSGYHGKGVAFDIVDKSGDESWYNDLWDKIAVYSDDFAYASRNGGIGAWYTGVAHQGSGWHVHADNYLGGLCGETDEEKAQMAADNMRTGGNGGADGAVGPISGPKMDSPRTHSFKVTHDTVEILPSKKTYCEPVYPDYIYVTGNIPNSSLERTVTSSSAGLTAANGDTYLMTGQGMQDLTGMDINAFTTDQAQAYAQRAFNPKDSISEVKVPSAGKPLNNNDPYPVDLKIEELESHMPRVKKYKLPYERECKVSEDISKAILSLSDYTEKRLVKIENLLATVMRYTFGIGSRMFINCQYYGGQDHRAKGVGKCIRCLRDDRCGDGQVMQLDQCLSCSRYEPIIGQTYDVLNEVGANLAAIQDDIQAGYMNMEDYVNWVRTEKMHNNRKDAQLAYTQTRVRDEDEQDFADIWDQGVMMGWKLVPVEKQKPQINWRQDICSQDKSPSKLASYQQANGLGGSGLNPKSTVSGGDNKKNATEHEGFLDAVAAGTFKDESGDSATPKIETATVKTEDGSIVVPLPRWDEMTGIVNSGKAKASEGIINETIETMASKGYEQMLQNVCKEKGIDSCLALAIAAVESHGDPEAENGLFGIGGGSIESQINTGIEKIAEAQKNKKNNNIIGVCTSFKGWDKLMDAINDEGSQFDKLWVGAMKKAGLKDLDFFPAVMQAYSMIPKKKTAESQATSSSVDGVEFPFKTSQLTNVFYVKEYGITNYGSGVTGVSDGIVLKVSAQEDVYSPVQGPASVVDGGVKIIDKTTGTQFVFTGMNNTASFGGEEAIVGQKIGSCNDVLVVKCYDKDGTAIDPKTRWELLGGKLSLDGSKSIGKYIADEAKKA